MDPAPGSLWPGLPFDPPSGITATCSRLWTLTLACVRPGTDLTGDVDPYRRPGTTVSTLRLRDRAEGEWGEPAPDARGVGGTTERRARRTAVHGWLRILADDGARQAVAVPALGLTDVAFRRAGGVGGLTASRPAGVLLPPSRA
ncbi:hypothetical protein ABZ368_28190 [Streptomyces sp. NPDC005908]|uniref:hypothetical protein n=1 Tax=unclassified Streptomyces TaxID=2593676 RepID=UPI0033C364D6